MSGSTYTWIRGNVLGLTAIFIALGGSAVAVQTAEDSPRSKAKLAKKKVKRGPRGPAGPQGAQGPAGANGVAGAVGPSEATTVFIDADQALNNSNVNSGVTQIASVELDPGAYLILAKTVLHEIAGSDNGITPCMLQSQNASDQSSTRLGNLTTPAGGAASSSAEVQDAVVSTQLTDTITTPTTVTYSCTKIVPFGTSVAQQTKLTAVRLGSETHISP